ncbi:MAG TPA: hypothetical protein VHZ02_06700 [Acidimicrobiales bacterium]|nr:hypothetical protein [Acidimicrobiales bacterium]
MGASEADREGGGHGAGTHGAGTSPWEGTSDPSEHQVAWGLPSETEHRWPAIGALAVAIALQVALPDRIIRGLGPRWLVPALEGALLIALIVANPGQITKESKRIRYLSLSLIALINIANVIALAELVNALLNSTKAGGRPLIFASVPIWLTNVIVFGLWYWELDRGGPASRLNARHRRPDFLFPQMTAYGAAPGWTPDFFDYLYTSFTNSTAFSPTDTMPVTAWAKLLMMLQSLASLLTVALVISRAVNILS